MNVLQQIGAAAALPEIALALLAMLMLMEGVFSKSVTPSAIRWGAIASLAAIALMVVWKSGTGSVTAFGGAFVADPFARFMKVLALGGSAFTLLLLANISPAPRWIRMNIRCWCSWPRWA